MFYTYRYLDIRVLSDILATDLYTHHLRVKEGADHIIG